MARKINGYFHNSTPMSNGAIGEDEAEWEKKNHADRVKKNQKKKCHARTVHKIK